MACYFVSEVDEEVIPNEETTVTLSAPVLLESAEPVSVTEGESVTLTYKVQGNNYDNNSYILLLKYVLLGIRSKCYNCLYILLKTNKLAYVHNILSLNL